MLSPHPSQNGAESDGNKGILKIPQSSSISRASLSDALVSYSGHPLVRSYPSAEIQSEYFAGPVYWALKIRRNTKSNSFQCEIL